MALAALLGVVVATVGSAQADATATIEVRVWQNVSDELEIHISARPAGGNWRILGTIPLPLVDGVSTSGQYRYGDISLGVPLANLASPAPVEVRVWQDVGDELAIYISARPAGGDWRTLERFRCR